MCSSKYWRSYEYISFSSNQIFLLFSRVVLIGHFNYSVIDWSNVFTKGSWEHLSLLVDVVFYNNLSKVVKCPKRRWNDSKYILDLVFLSKALAKNIVDMSIEEGILHPSIVVGESSPLHCTRSKNQLKRYRDSTWANNVDILDLLSETLEECFL